MRYVVEETGIATTTTAWVDPLKRIYAIKAEITVLLAARIPGEMWSTVNLRYPALEHGICGHSLVELLTAHIKEGHTVIEFDDLEELCVWYLQNYGSETCA